MSQGFWSVLSCTSSLHSVKWCNYPISGSSSVEVCQRSVQTPQWSQPNTLPKTNIAPEKWRLGNYFAGTAYSRRICYVSFKEGIIGEFIHTHLVRWLWKHLTTFTKFLTFEGETLKITQSGTSSSRWFQPICKIFTGFGATQKKPLKPPNLLRLCLFLPWDLLFHPLETSTLSGFIYTYQFLDKEEHLVIDW